MATSNQQQYMYGEEFEDFHYLDEKLAVGTVLLVRLYEGRRWFYTIKVKSNGCSDERWVIPDPSSPSFIQGGFRLTELEKAYFVTHVPLPPPKGLKGNELYQARCIDLEKMTPEIFEQVKGIELSNQVVAKNIRRTNKILRREMWSGV